MKAKLILIICCFLWCFFLPLKITQSSSANFLVLLPGKLKTVNLELSLRVSRQAGLEGGLYFTVAIVRRCTGRENRKSFSVERRIAPGCTVQTVLVCALSKKHRQCLLVS